ncbi:MAG: putative acyl-CoA dehydrogenase YngJ, partial [Pseudomonadota bacterium]
MLNGQKTWITGAHVADRILLVCRTSREESKHQGISMIFVPTDADGVEIRPIQTMGGREVNDVFFTDCEVPAEALLGEE